MIARGRVLATTGGTLTLFDGGAITHIDDVPHGAAAIGDLVVVRSGEGGVCVTRAHAHDGEWPPPCGDGARLLSRWSALRRRAELLDATRRWFRDAGFLEVDTPLLVPSPGTEVHLDAVPATLTPRPGAAPEPRWLITSPELHMKRLLAAGAPPIFQLARVFRDGERGANHRPEFTMLEWYRPWAGYERLMEDCESWICSLAGGARRLTWQGRAVDLTRPWPRLRFYDLMRDRADLVAPEGLDADRLMVAFVERVEPTLGRDHPEIVMEWPISMASLARPAPHDPRVAERFELFIAGLELGNAFGELTDAAEQRRRCEAENAARRSLGKPPYPIDEDFLAALASGMPPSAGVAVGIDRVVMLLADQPTIDDVLPF